jgi:hypothetical protein
MKVPRNADDRAADVTAFLIPFFDGLRAVRMIFKGRYVEKAHVNDRNNLDKA